MVTQTKVSLSLSDGLMNALVFLNAALGLEFACGHLLRCLSLTDHSEEGGRHLLRWPTGTPNASVLSELALCGSPPHGTAVFVWPPLGIGLRNTCAALCGEPGTWAHWCRSLLINHSCWPKKQTICATSALHSVRFDVVFLTELCHLWPLYQTCRCVVAGSCPASS